MKSLAVLILLALIGIAFAGWSAANGRKPQPIAQPVVAPAESAFAATLAGAGLVEPAGEVVRIGTPLGDVLATVLVAPGQTVTAGAPLFTLDDRATRAQEAVALAAVNVAMAARDEARDNAGRADDQIFSIEERARRAFGLVNATALLEQAAANLAAVRIDLDRRTVRAPRAGTILRVDARPGEFAPTGRLDPPLVTLGDLAHLQIRVDIDENDAWRFQAKAPAEAVVRGNPALRTPLTFVRVEPYVVPKKSLTGLSAERVDTRVLQVIYAITTPSMNLYAGQQMDVFIQDSARAP